ncbi:hypothetical protein ACS0TY_010865 [Phlomoides rotata]
MTEECKKYQIIEKQFQHCADLAMESIEKMEFIEQQCNAMKSALLNWNPTTTTNNEGPSVRVPQSPVVEGGLILDPNVTRTVGRPRESRYRSAVETYGRDTNRRQPRLVEPIEGGECPHPVRRAHRRGPRGRGKSVARPNEPIEGGGRGRGLGESNDGPNEAVDESGRGQGAEGDGFPFNLNV